MPGRYGCRTTAIGRGPGTALAYKLRYIVGFGLVEMDISTNPKRTMYRNLYENAEPDVLQCKTKRQYLLTLQVTRHCLLTLQYGVLVNL